MPGIDEKLTFYPLRIAVLTISDTRDEQTDKSGALLAERLTAARHAVSTPQVAPVRDRNSNVSDLTPEAVDHRTISNSVIDRSNVHVAHRERRFSASHRAAGDVDQAMTSGARQRRVKEVVRGRRRCLSTTDACPRRWTP